MRADCRCWLSSECEVEKGGRVSSGGEYVKIVSGVAVVSLVPGELSAHGRKHRGQGEEYGVELEGYMIEWTEGWSSS